MSFFELGLDYQIKYTHVAVVAIFLLLFTYKFLLLARGKKSQLQTVRERTKVVEMILGTLILVTGGYLFYRTGYQVWLGVKLTAFIACIPLGIIGLKREKLPLVLVSLIGFLYLYGMSETHSATFRKPTYAELPTGTPEELLATGAVIYKAECVRCHGEDGAKEAFLAYNLKESYFNPQQMASYIANGNVGKKMPAYGKRLSKAHLLAVATYAETLSEVEAE